MIKVEVVNADEIEALQKIIVRTFLDSFGHLNEAHNIEIYVNDALSLECISDEFQTIGSDFYFAKIDDDITAYLKLNTGPAQTDQVLDKALEIQRIYVKKAYERNGIGLRLMHLAISRAQALELKWIWLGVWDQNYNAIKFYEHLGFETFGHHDFMLGRELQVDLLMRMRV